MEMVGLGILTLFIIFGSMLLNFVVWIWSIIDCSNTNKSNKTALIVAMVLIPPIGWIYALFITPNRSLKKFVLVSVLSLIGSGFILINRGPVAAKKIQNVQANEKRIKIVEKSKFPKTRITTFAPILALNTVPVDRHSTGVSLGTYTPSGFKAAEAVSTHKNLIAIAGTKNNVFGITGHPSLSFGRVDLKTGMFQELPLPSGFSWPRAIAYDSAEKRVLVLSRGNAHFYDPKTKTYASAPQMANLNIGGLTFNNATKLYYGMVHSHGVGFNQIITINGNGAVFSKKKINPPIPSNDIEANIQVYMMSASKIFAILFDSENGSQTMYLIDTNSGSAKQILWPAH